MQREMCVDHIRAIVGEVVHGLFEEASKWPEGNWLYAAESYSRQAGRRLAQEILQALIDRAGPGHRGHRMEDTTGRAWTFKQYRTRQVQTLVGEVTVNRAVYRSASGAGETWVPLDEALGLHGSYSPGLEELVAYTVGRMTYQATSEQLEKTLGIRLSVTKIQSTAERWGQEVAEDRAKRLPREPAQRRMAVAVDGAMVRTARRRRKRKGSRKQHFEEQWTEAKLGVVYAFGRKGRASVEKRYTASIRGKDAFGQALWQQIAASGVDRASHVAWLGDGAEWIWSLKAEHLPHAEEILDFRHARDHLDQVTISVWSPRSRKAARWLKTQIGRLATGRIDRVLKELRRLSRQIGPPPSVCDDDDPRKVVARNLTYFQNNAARMRYDEYRRKGYPIGSGVVESACGHVVGQRMKITSRMSWRSDRAEAILQLRCLVRSGQWDAFWPVRRFAA